VPLDLATLAADLRDNAFGFRRSAPRPPVIGAEVELIPVDAETRAIVPVSAEDGPSTLPLLRSFAARHGWREEPSPYGAPFFHLPDGGLISYEPGGQVELSAPPFRSASALLKSLRDTVLPLRREARDAGIELLSVGVDPANRLEDVALQLHGPRYLRLTRFLESLGTGGVRMMRQTAAFQCNLDWCGDALERWRFLNALTPYLTAVFASSPVYAGAETGERSFRARVWRELDGGRTGIFPRSADPIADYLRFALDAPAILLPTDADLASWEEDRIDRDHEDADRGDADRSNADRGDGDRGNGRSGDAHPAWPSFRAWNNRGAATMEDWHRHLTTLFPDVRPKGFVEVRSIDAVEPEWYAARLVFLGGLTYHEPTFAAAADLAGDPDPALLDRAGRLGLRDERIASVARDLFELALEGATALGPAFLCPADLEEARAFFDTYTRQSLSPADDATATSVASTET
jgi:glutamate--cysteine ligase